VSKLVIRNQKIKDMKNLGSKNGNSLPAASKLSAPASAPATKSLKPLLQKNKSNKMMMRGGKC
jgi:hypothetical protein